MAIAPITLAFDVYGTLIDTHGVDVIKPLSSLVSGAISSFGIPSGAG